jgi:hypothetical protein
VFDHIRYDTLRFKAGADTPTSVFRLFQVPRGQSTTVANAPTESYIKDLIDTNMEAAGTLPAGQEMIVHSIQVFVNIPGQTDTSYPTSGPGAELPTNPAFGAFAVSSNLMRAVLTQAYLRFKVGEKTYEEGPLYQFPSAFGISGFSGQVTTATATTFGDSVSNNGFGRPRELFEPRHIPELVNFGVDIQFIQPLTITRQFTLSVLLHGLLFRPVQ